MNATRVLGEAKNSTQPNSTDTASANPRTQTGIPSRMNIDKKANPPQTQKTIAAAIVDTVRWLLVGSLILMSSVTVHTEPRLRGDRVERLVGRAGCDASLRAAVNLT
jgi:hypothetical protein